MVKVDKNRGIKAPLFFAIFYLFTIDCFAKSVKVHWFGTTFLILETDTSAILFDPFISRPSLWKILSFQDLKEKEDVYNKWVPMTLQKKIKGIFISHTHYDHILDLGLSMKNNNSVLYGSKSARNIAKGKMIPLDRVKIIEVDKSIFVDKFKITTREGKHPSHIFGMTLAEGTVEKFKDPASAFSYKTGDVYTFEIEIEDKRIFIASSGVPIWKKHYNRIDYLFQGVANKRHYNELVEKQVVPSRAKKIIPIHFDDFFESVDKPLTELISADVEKFKKLIPNGQGVIIPQFGKSVIVD